MKSLAATLPFKTVSIPKPLAAFVIVAGAIFAASLFGILTRPMGFLAAIWPANAILLGLMVRNRELSNPAGWVGAILGYLAADVVTGGNFVVVLWLTAANLVGVVTGYLLFQRLSEGDRQLHRPQSVLFLFAICVAAAAAAGIVGSGAADVVFGQGFLSGFEFWFVTELVNMLVILPMILTFRHHEKPVEALAGSLRRNKNLWRYAPVLALVVSTGVAIAVGGPGAIAFPVPALLWCALTYGMFFTSVLTAAACSLLLITVTSGLTSASMFDDMLASASSMRLGISLIALGPLTAASINASRMDLIRQLSYSANHDGLTGILNRRAFLERASRVWERLKYDQRSMALLVLDIDHFKSINDKYGHATGDRVLTDFAQCVSAALRVDDIFARLGGEEFAILLPDISQHDASAVADRIRRAVAARSEENDTRLPPITISIGVAMTHEALEADFAHLMVRADEAMYRAKAEGRNRAVTV